MEKRSFTKEDRLRIIKEASMQGVAATLEKYGIFRATFYSWKKKFEEMGEEGLKHGMTPQHLKRIRELEKENTTLKQILAEKELENKMQEELLKKKLALERKKKL